MSETAFILDTGGEGQEIDGAPGLPLGLGHIANLAHLVQAPDGMAPAGARVVTDDVRILFNGWRIPGRLPVSATEARPVKRFQATFTPDHFRAEVEFAWRDLTPNPHRSFGPGWTPPTMDADGTVHIHDWPGIVGLPSPWAGPILALATSDLDTVNNVPSFGHQIPSTATGYLWHDGGADSDFNLTDMHRMSDPSEALTVGTDQYWFVSLYWTNESGDSAPSDSMMWDAGLGAARWSFPYTFPKWIPS